MKDPIRVVGSYVIRKQLRCETKEGELLWCGPRTGLFSRLVVKERRYTILIDRVGSLLRIKNKEYTFDLMDISPIIEDYKKLYLKYVDVSGKTVIDVGGYMGVSAVIFAKDGKARRVIVYELHPIFQKYIQQNIKLNNLDDRIELKRMGVLNRDGFLDISIDTLSGMEYSIEQSHKDNEKKARVRVTSWVSLIESLDTSKVGLIKVDCEGCEKYLVDVGCKLLSSINQWIIETHSPEIEKSVLSKFEKCGFRKKLIKKLTKEVSLFRFDRGV